MIKNYDDYIRYLMADQKALRRTGHVTRMSLRDDPVWRYERLLREREYLFNCHGTSCSLYWRIRRRLNTIKFNKLANLLGFTIPINRFDKGLCIAHRGTIVVNHHAKIGKNCEINSDVNIGMDFNGKAPTIGDNCFIAPGAKIFGEVVIGDNVIIGANAVVNKSFPEGNCTLIGVPARKYPLRHPLINGDRYTAS